VGLERGPLSLVSTTEELFGRNNSGSGLEIQKIQRVPRDQRDGSLRPYSRFSRQEPLLFYKVAPQLYSQG
jgi:hypothetical protein